MTNIHTPDGVRDFYGKELSNKNYIVKQFVGVSKTYGYREIQTPTIEFIDSFSDEVGSANSKEFYKFFDKEGNTLILRPDFTPSIARCASKYYKEDDMPLRFCYRGSTFTNTQEHQGKLNETTQLGLEFINDSSSAADAEVISAAIEGLIRSGLDDFQIIIGDINFFKGICEEANLDEETENYLRDYIASKNYFGTKSFLAKHGLSESYAEYFDKISSLFMKDIDLVNLKDKVKSSKSKEAIDRLLFVKELLSIKGFDKYISFDLSLLSKHHYYTGIIFKGYTYGVGQPIILGGRYDKLLGKFGKNAPAVGCVCMADLVLNALMRQGKEIGNGYYIDYLLVYSDDKYKECILKADSLRLDRRKVAMFRYDAGKDEEFYREYAKNNGFNSVEFYI